MNYGEFNNDNLVGRPQISPYTTFAAHNKIIRQKICFDYFIYIVSYILCAIVFLELGALLTIQNLDFTKLENSSLIILNENISVKSLIIVECAATSLFFLVCLCQLCSWIRQ